MMKFNRFLVMKLILPLCMVFCGVINSGCTERNEAKINKILDNKLIKEKVFRTDELFPQADLVCILPYYVRSTSLNIKLSSEQREKLSNIINGNVGDTHWWFVVFQRNGDLEPIKFYGLSVPSFRSARCLEKENSVISFVEKDVYIYFNFYKEK